MDKIPDFHRLQKCKKKAEEKSDLKELGTICNALGELLSQYGYLEEAIAEHEMEKRVSEAAQDKIGDAVASRKIGECLCKLGQFDKALQFQNQYLALAQECNDQVEIQRALATLGDTYYTQADVQGADCSRHLLEKAEKKFLQALRVSSELRGSSTLTEPEYMAMKGRLLLNLGLVYDVRGAEKESKEYLQKALTIAKQWHLEEEQFLCHFNSANQELRHGQPAAAQVCLQQALTSATRLENKPRQKEVFSQLAIASVSAGDTKSAKHFLKKAYKLLPTAKESNKLVKLYKAVTVVEELSERRSACDHNDGDMFSIHEKLGDAFTEIGLYCGSYATAIQHYQQMVECGERLGLGAERLIPAYVSLAQTYADNRQPDLAISSYHQELQLRGEDQEQICRTWLNIAELQEKKGDGYKVLSKTYMTAFSHAKKANHLKLQVQVLRSLIATQEVFKERRHKEQTEAKLKQLQAKHGLKSGEGSSEEEEDSQPQDSDGSVDPDHKGDISISDLTDSDKSDEENVRPVMVHQQLGTTRVRRHKTFKKNEKGETPLHVACINGNLKRVGTLLAEGHPVNVRDHCGWTPLHEAANHNYPAVVEALLDAGADINDRGGAQCNGFTPLIDASACGNLDIVRILIERGANILAKDDRGFTALQALRDWYRDYADTLDQDVVAQYSAVLQLFQDKLPGNAGLNAAGSAKADTRRAGDSLPQAGSSKADNSVARHTSQRKTKPRHHSGPQSAGPRSTHSAAHEQVCEDSGSSEEEEEEEPLNVYNNPQLEDLASTAQSATEAYRTSILALGSSTQRAEVRASVTKPARRNRSDKHHPALVSEQEMVGDDWLIDDLGSASRKRRDRSGALGGFLSSDSVRSARENKRARLATKWKRNVTKPGSGDIVWTSEDSSHENRLLSSPEGSRHERRSTSPSESGRNRLSASTPLNSSSTPRVVSSSSDSGSGDDEESLPVLTHGVKRPDSSVASALSVAGTESVVGGREQAGRRLSGGGECQAGSLSQGQPSVGGGHHVSPPQAVVSAQLARVKVRIEGSVFLVPLPAAEERTVGWLSEEASQRYCSHFGRRPFLTLSSSDGAILSTEDVLSAVLSRDEQLDGTVHGWDQPSLSDRYAQACKTLNAVKYRNVCGILKEAETTHQLSLSGLGLRPSVLLPITRALHGETSLTQLHLPDNHLGDSGLRALAAALQDLRGLTHLSVSGNDITASGFKHLADLFLLPAENTAHSAPTPLQMLELLDVSHNPLGSSIADSLCSIVRGLLSLTALAMSSCGLTARLFQHNRPALAACLQERSLQRLDVSHNHLGVLGVELLLWSVPAPRLTHLDLAHTCSDASPGHLARHLKVFVNQDCALQALSLENCSLHQEDIHFICRLPEQVPSLRKLNIAVNRAVTGESLQNLLHTSAHCPHSQLSHLEAEACSLASPLLTPSSLPSPPVTTSSTTLSSSSSSFLNTLRQKLSAPHALQYLALPCAGLEKGDRERLCEVWTQRWPQGSVEFSGQSVVLASQQR